ncbi:MAG: molecular chaperone HtpG [Bdellovibrionota bacterium]
MAESGKISIHAENILPIIKKWLYSEKEIFIRELVSNAADALQKLEKLSLLGHVEGEIPEARINVVIDKDKKTLTITDTGLGMTDDEVKKYINQVAFSSLQEFVDKYQDKDLKEQNIGHFGLGFYSAFMVASKVEINTLSYQKGADAVRWICDGSIDYEMSKSDKAEVGTSITLYITDDNMEMLNHDNIRRLLNRYCAFLNKPIYFEDKMVNDPTPLWVKSPSQLKDEDYLEFYRKLFPFNEDPLFWIHLNVDFPFNLKGILYFPKLQHELDASQGQVNLYCNQVFVAEDSKDLLPEWLTLLKGAIDCPDLPLNVSRSYLQHDAKVKRIASHIVKKVADKLTGLAKTDSEKFHKCWDGIHAFVKFGILRDESFYDRMSEYVIFQSSNGDYTRLDDYLERMKDKTDGKIVYATDKKAQASALKMFAENGLEAIIADTMIDSHLIQYLEMKSSGKYKFVRIDADVSKFLLHDEEQAEIIDPKDNKTLSQKVEDVFTRVLGKEKVKIRVENLKADRVPAMLLVDENTRRLKEMAAAGHMGSIQMPMQDQYTLVVNRNNGAVKNVINMASMASKDEDVKLAVNQIYDLATLQNGEMTSENMQSFVDRSTQILERLVGKVGESGV